jgi:hypothetical protein
MTTPRQIADDIEIPVAKAICGDDHLQCTYPDCGCKVIPRRLPAVMALIESALTAARGEWKSIDSAPKDGTRVLLWCPEDKSLWFAHWARDEWFGVDELGLTRIGHDPGTAVTGWFPTLWQPMPLPPPPAPAGD